VGLAVGDSLLVAVVVPVVLCVVTSQSRKWSCSIECVSRFISWAVAEQLETLKRFPT